MKFGEKVRLLRNEKKLSQTELGKMCGLSLRTIRNYEVDGRYPKQREVYTKLAAALGCEVNFLLAEDEEFVLQAQQTYGYKGARDAEELVAGVSALFAGGLCRMPIGWRRNGTKKSTRRRSIGRIWENSFLYVKTIIHTFRAHVIEQRS